MSFVTLNWDGILHWLVTAALIAFGGYLLWSSTPKQQAKRAARIAAKNIIAPAMQVVPARAVSSTFGKMIFSCNDSRTAEGRNLEQWRKEFEQSCRVWGDAHGTSTDLTILPDGYRLEMRGKTPETVARRLGLMWTLEIRRATPDTVVAVSYLEWETLNIGGIDFAAAMNPVLKMLPIDPDAEYTKQFTKYIAGLLQLDESQFKVI